MSSKGKREVRKVTLLKLKVEELKAVMKKLRLETRALQDLYAADEEVEAADGAERLIVEEDESVCESVASFTTAAPWTEEVYEREGKSSTLAASIKDETEVEIISPVARMSFPPSHAQSHPLLPFVYTLQRLQIATSEDLIEWEQLCKETRKLDAAFPTEIKYVSKDKYLNNAQQHVDLCVKQIPNGQTFVGLKDVDLPWHAGSKTIGAQYPQEEAFSPLVEILFYCNPNSSRTLNNETLLKYLNFHAKLSLRDANDLDEYCKQAANVCQLVIKYHTKSFEIKLFNRMRPFKSEVYNREFFKRDLQPRYDLKQRLEEATAVKKRARLEADVGFNMEKKAKIVDERNEERQH